MEPSALGEKYDKIAQWWHDQHVNSSYGVKQLQRAIEFAASGGKALDIGCGSGGRFVYMLQSSGFLVAGLDVSKEMIKLATSNHPEHKFFHQDISTWETEEKFDFIVAWDSMFHLPLVKQKPVISKMCQLLDNGGILIYTFGNAEGEHTDQWHNDNFYYSSIGINENIKLLIDNGLSILHLELDQYSEKHVYTIAKKT